MLFEDRNKEYGAYVMRRDAGRRYALALGIIGGILVSFLLAIGVVAFVVYKQVKDITAELQDLTKIERLRPIDNHQFKEVAQGQRTQVDRGPDKGSERLEIVDGMTHLLEYGVNADESESASTEFKYEVHDSVEVSGADLPQDGLRLTPTDVVEEMPRFPGGIGALMKWLDSHIVYTYVAQRDKVVGDMEITFIVDKEGRVSDVKVTKPLHPSLDRVALQAVRMMPRWEPGRRNGSLALVQITLPIHFQLK